MKLRRKSGRDAEEAAPEEVAGETVVDASDDVTDVPAAVPADTDEGPYDADDLPDDGVGRVDLGALLVAPVPGRDLRVQVDEKSGEVKSVVLAGQDGAVELRAYAAPRHGDLWSEVRPQIAADAARRGGTATEQDGPFGTELFCEVQVKTAEGQVGNQASRVIGFNGPRWLLRATFLGRPAVDADALAEWRGAVTSVAVRRGAQAMPVGEALPLTLPEEIKAQAQRAATPGQQTGA
ncbi:DUF3710 domain-containing protein [Nocardioides humilatus]|uniref:DUF3710 domain-containing protein n=1 Tax=Nocardioides humilatus TaxID=2607660 RepID=A0A5B1L6N0_9ACTN|nr:DUF3710 domain-containing protein [Nocardioides humilatus]KAA1416323.1 DUF3710 domain-containing protein [Nocardioides humilatus]